MMAASVLLAPESTRHQQAHELKLFDPEQIRDGIRAVLIEVNRTVLFTEEFVQPIIRKAHAADDGTFGVPCFYVEYLIEATDPEKQETMAVSDVRVLQDGQDIGEVEGSIPGGIEAVYEYGDTHRRFGIATPSADAARARVRTMLISGMSLEKERIDIEILLRVDDQEKRFLFRDVPLS